ncbi:MAG: hypothetical protein Q8M24_11960 [Pseudolabrys sp.]|nr:hypothetical protein [Pseudolabrys sp.]MDP2296162.1 hypothetical protein [Pseudolabrys sp.]
MATRQHRLSEFNGGPPPPDVALQLLCEDHNGTYVLPYPCRWQGDIWRNCASNETIEAAVVGWREVPPPRTRSAT